MKNLATRKADSAYEHNERQLRLPEEFWLPFGGKLNPNNRWCKLAVIIPWAEIEDRYARALRDNVVKLRIH